MTKYSDLLKDPRWQKKRLEIFSRDAWTCRQCLCGSKTLNVHHILYESRFPWETSDKYLITLCEDCHSIEENLTSDEMYRIMQSVGLTRMNTITILREVGSYFHFVENIDVNSVEDFIQTIGISKENLALYNRVKIFSNG